MFDVSGIPNMGFGGGGYFGGNAATGQPAMSADQINASMGWNPNAAQFNPFANSGGSFGAMPAHYAGLGAAYGRATGGFNAKPGAYGTIGNPFGGGGGGVPQGPASPSGKVEYGGDLPPADMGGYDPFNSSTWGAGRDALARTMTPQPQPQPQANPYAQMYRMPTANPSYFNPGTYAGDKGNYGLPYKGASLPGDIGFSKQSQMPNLGYNPGMSNWFANPGMSGGGFQSRYGLGFPNSATPSQYAPNAAMPPSFSRPYSFDNQGGALPLGGGSGGDPFGIIPGG